jgi:histidinol-phosphate phosphatase family protein
MNKKKAVFLDRDGVINENRIDYVKNTNELKIFDFVGSSITELKSMGFLVVVVTNQSAINRGLTTEKLVNEIHDEIQKYLKNYETVIDRFYFCPHKPNEKCNCRKPKPGLLEKAILEIGIEPNKSWMIGDNDSDIIAGIEVGCQTIKLDNNFNLKNAVEQIRKKSSI